MIGIPVNLNTVYVSTVPTGCCKVEFDSTYPIHLNGIISQHEYQESINKINHAISSNKSLLILGLAFALSTIGGMICFIVGGFSAVNTVRYGFPPLIGVGIGITIAGSMFFIIGAVVLQFRRISGVRQAIAEESMKYSSRSPIPCSWRLETTRHYVGGYGNQNNGALVYHLVIDIGRSTVPANGTYNSNQVAPDPAIYFGQQNNYAPPPYSDQASRFCSQCSAPRQDLSARFCSSCGHSFNKY